MHKALYMNPDPLVSFMEKISIYFGLYENPLDCAVIEREGAQRHFLSV